MRTAILIGLLLSLCPPAGAQQKVPAAQLIDRLYPGNARAIEKRLATSSTLTATPRVTASPSTGSLVLRFRRPSRTDQRTSAPIARTANKTTTRTLVPVPIDELNRLGAKTPDRPTTTGPARASIPPANSGGDLEKYLSSLAKPVPVSTPANPAQPGAAKTKTPVAIPIERLTSVINMNRAGEAELMRVLKIDALRARMIVEFRSTQRPIRDAEDLAQVNGLTGDMILKWQKEGVLKFD